ncbi:MAG: DUF1330 domain-containing protein [Chromatiales bacterium]|nr:MAG: DUF1330 domain-containing protein [Chromatiales bacterium]
MTRQGFPVFLAAQIPAAVGAADYLATAAELAVKHGGQVLAATAAADVECLEAGTPDSSILLAQFDDDDNARAFWQADAQQERFAPLAAAPETSAILVNGLPFVGLPDMPEIPTTASVTPPTDRGPRAYMIIQGTATDQPRMDQYRDIILPMIAEQGAYYICFEIEGNAERLHGEWTHNIFAISRWPDHAAGHAFWDSDRYQNVAIPTRTGAGHFWVHFMPGLTG